jgi:hypothetical protein
MISMSGENLKHKYLVPSGARGRSYHAGQRTSPAKAKNMSNAEMQFRLERRRHSQQVNARIKVVKVLHPSMKVSFVKTVR